MVDKGSTSRKRILILGLTFFGWFLINVFRLFYVQVLSNDKYKQKLTRQNERVLEVSSERGAILDRNRRPLAMNADGYSFYLENRSVEESLKELARFQSLFSYTPSETKRLESMIRQKRSFIWLKRKVSEEEKATRKERVAKAKDALARSVGMKGDHVASARAALKRYLQQLNDPRQPDDAAFEALIEAPFQTPQKKKPGRR